MAIETLPKEGFVRLPAVLAIFPVGRSTWWAGVKSGRYPAPVKLSPRVTAWRVEDIRALVDRLLNENCGGNRRV
jgi:predicted DNA-binding transcriptional regulator AlpA